MTATTLDNTGTLQWEHGTTWYRVVGDLKSKLIPAVVIHGGPGAPHNYVLGIVNLIASTGRPVIVYDQIGSGQSTHLKDKPSEFWTVDLFKQELNHLLKELKVSKKYILIGQSWGGILSFAHAVDKPKGLKGLIIANSLASVPKWLPEIERLVSELPAVHRKAVAKGLKSGNFAAPDFAAANDYFTAQHLVRVPAPSDVAEAFTELAANPTVYEAMWGPVEFAPIGSLRTWDVEDQLKNIKVPTLLINGKFDEVTPKTQKRLVKKIKGAEWVCLPFSSHLSWVEEPAAWLDAVNSFLKRKKL
jgi:L-proline amide hydrolase